MESPDHLFRHESGRMVAVLTHLFGVHNLSLAEDVVQEAFVRALEAWKFNGMPENPSAWLMKTAKNAALDVLRKERTARTYAPELGRLLESEWTVAPVVEEFFAPNAIQDDQLRMMFSCCHPRLPEEAQVALILNILCGFSVDEIAAAFVSSHAAIEKRITRAKKVLAGSKTLFDLTAPADFAARLPAVHRALYLLLSEGYHGANPETAIRLDLCHEAMRLAAILIRHPQGATPATYALSALMCLSTARIPARINTAGNLSTLFDQDRSLWNKWLIAEGLDLLDLSATGTKLTEYHVEAAIASIHAAAARAEDTDWNRIISLYDTLMTLRSSPIIALNRAIAIAQKHGPARGLEEIRNIPNADRLTTYPFYPAALGELELRQSNHRTARDHFQTALALARNPMERRFLEQRIRACGDHLEAPR